MSSNNSFLTSRCALLRSAGAGFGHLALAGLLGESAAKAAGAPPVPKPLAAKAPHFTPKAKRIIFLFMEGAISGVDTFEYKVELQITEANPGREAVFSHRRNSNGSNMGSRAPGSLSCCRTSRNTRMTCAEFAV